MRFTWPRSSSSSMNTIPFAVAGRWRAIASPANQRSTRAPCLMQLGARQRPRRQVRTEERERVRPDRETGLPVVREHSLPARQVGQLGRLRRRLERQRELLRLALRPLHRARPGREAELPEKVASRGPKPSQAPPGRARRAPPGRPAHGERGRRRRERGRSRPVRPRAPRRRPFRPTRRTRAPPGRPGTTLVTKLQGTSRDPSRRARDSSEQRASLRLTSGERTSTPRRCASRTRLAGG